MKTSNLGNIERFQTIRELYLEWSELSHGRRYADVLIEYASKPEVKTVTEFGTFQGMSACAFLTTDIEKLYSYDITFKHMHQGEVELIRRLKRPEADWILTEGDSHKPIEHKSDIIFLDTVHTRDHVSKEVEIHHPKAEKYLIVHDTNYPKGLEAGDSNRIDTGLFEFIQASDGAWSLDFHSKEGTGIMVLKEIIELMGLFGHSGVYKSNRYRYRRQHTYDTHNKITEVGINIRLFAVRLTSS